MKNYIVVCLLLCSLTWTSAQVGIGSTSNYGKWRVGGSLGIGFGNNSYFGINISPYAGYAITPSLEAGLTTGFQYSKDDYFSSNIFTVGPYANYYLLENIFARANFEYLTGKQEFDYSNYKYDVDESALWLGAGYQSTGAFRYQIGLMYNVLYDEDESIYSSGLRPFAGIAVSL